MRIPIDMNGFDILKTSHYLHGYLITNLSDKTFIINGGKRVLLSNNSIIKQIQVMYNTFKFNYKLLHTQVHYWFVCHYMIFSYQIRKHKSRHLI